MMRARPTADAPNEALEPETGPEPEHELHGALSVALAQGEEAYARGEFVGQDVVDALLIRWELEK